MKSPMSAHPLPSCIGRRSQAFWVLEISCGVHCESVGSGGQCEHVNSGIQCEDFRLGVQCEGFNLRIKY